MIDLTEKGQRHEYMVKRLRMLIAFQVRLLRIQRGWTQAQLAEKCGTKQPAIADIENWDKEFPLLSTLKKLAEVFDCGLIVRFEGWEEIVESIVPEGKAEFEHEESHHGALRPYAGDA